MTQESVNGGRFSQVRGFPVPLAVPGRAGGRDQEPASRNIAGPAASGPDRAGPVMSRKITLHGLTRTLVVAGAVLFFLLVAALAVLGAIGSFTTVRHEAHRWFGNWDWIVPIGVDIGIAALLTWDLVQEYLTRQEVIDRGLPVLRWIAWAYIAGTVYLNVATAHGNLTGIVMHGSMPLLFVSIVEGVRITIRRRARLTRRIARRRESRAEHLELRWLLLFPRDAFPLWRRAQQRVMLDAYRAGLDMERTRAAAFSEAKKVSGGRRARRQARRSGIATAILSKPGATPDDTASAGQPQAPAQQADPDTGPRRAASQPGVPPPAPGDGQEGSPPAGPTPEAAAGSPAALTAALAPAGGSSAPNRRPAAAAAVHVPDVNPGLVAEALRAAVLSSQFAQARELISDMDHADFARWLNANKPPGYKRLVYLTAIAATGGQRGTKVRDWIFAHVRDFGTVQMKEIREMASMIGPGPVSSSPAMPVAREEHV